MSKCHTQLRQRCFAYLSIRRTNIAKLRNCPDITIWTSVFIVVVFIVIVSVVVVFIVIVLVVVFFVVVVFVVVVFVVVVFVVVVFVVIVFVVFVVSKVTLCVKILKWHPPTH